MLTMLLRGAIICSVLLNTSTLAAILPDLSGSRQEALKLRNMSNTTRYSDTSMQEIVNNLNESIISAFERANLLSQFPGNVTIAELFAVGSWRKFKSMKSKTEIEMPAVLKRSRASAGTSPEFQAEQNQSSQSAVTPSLQKIIRTSMYDRDVGSGISLDTPAEKAKRILQAAHGINYQKVEKPSIISPISKLKGEQSNLYKAFDKKEPEYDYSKHDSFHTEPSMLSRDSDNLESSLNRELVGNEIANDLRQKNINALEGRGKSDNYSNSNPISDQKDHTSLLIPNDVQEAGGKSNSGLEESTEHESEVSEQIGPGVELWGPEGKVYSSSDLGKDLGTEGEAETLSKSFGSIELNQTESPGPMSNEILGGTMSHQIEPTSSSLAAHESEFKSGEDVPADLVSPSKENATQLTNMVYKIAKQEGVINLAAAPCHKTLAWMPKVVAKLENDLPAFTFHCVDTRMPTEESDDLVSAFETSTSVQFSQVGPTETESEFPENMDLVVSWMGMQEWGAGQSWRFVKGLRRKGAKLVLFGNVADGRNTAPENHSLNLRQSPLLFKNPVRVVSGVGVEDGNPKQLLLYKMDSIRDGF